MAVRWKKTSATKSCLVVVGISFIISIYIHTMSINPSRDQALYRAIVVYGDLAQYDDIEAKTGHV